MRVGILGAGGFIGTHLSRALQARGDVVASASLRDPKLAAETLGGCDAVINLAGEPIGGRRWTEELKTEVLRSRTELPREFLQSLRAHSPRLKTYVSASAVGYYGTSESATFDESSPPGRDFLAAVCVEWEAEAQRARDYGMRAAWIRNGLVLGADGGALAKILPIFQKGIGGKLGSGRQWHSWIHIADLVGIYLFALDGQEGALNATAPNPVRNSEFTKILGRVIRRPTFFPAPKLVLEAFLGEGASTLTEGQRVLPTRTVQLGYRFAYPQLEPALRQIVQESRPKVA